MLVACDVGQGDGLVLRRAAARRSWSTPAPTRRPMDALPRPARRQRVPLLVLTHFHADHVDGLAGVLDGRAVGAVEVPPLADPPEGAARGRRARAARPGCRPRRRRTARRGGSATLTLQVLWPLPGRPPAGRGDGSPPTTPAWCCSSRWRGVRLLLTGDVEPDAQAALARRLAGLRVDVLKVPHHGCRYQDLEFLTGLGARLAWCRWGEDNDYGHPAPETLTALSAGRAPRCCAPTWTATWSWWCGTASSRR